MIGIFDSGVGGLSILQELRKALPNADFTYFGDTANVPYGGRPRKEIIELSTQAVRALLRDTPDLVVVACNTATSVAIEELRRSFPHLPIVGVVPVLKTATAHTRKGKAAVLATGATLQSDSYRDLKQKFASGVAVLELALPEWVELVEEGKTTPSRHPAGHPSSLEEGRVVAQSVRGVAQNIRHFGADIVVMGCTHFVFLRASLERELPGVEILDSGPAVARQVVRVLTANGKLPEPGHVGSVKYFCSGDVEQFELVAGRLMGERSIRAEG